MHLGPEKVRLAAADMLMAAVMQLKPKEVRLAAELLMTAEMHLRPE
jgi:hypothetical protein